MRQQENNLFFILKNLFILWLFLFLFFYFLNFLIVCFFLILSCMSCLCILEMNAWSTDLFANIFSHSEGCLFILFMVSFALQKLLSFVRSHLFIFVFISLTLGGGSKRILQ